MEIVSCATWHPAFIARKNARLSGVVHKDLSHLKKLATGWRRKWDISSNLYKPSVKQVEQELAKMHGARVAYDIETDGQHPMLCKVRCIAFYDGKRAICIPFLFRDGTYETVPVIPGTKSKKTDKRPVWKSFYSGEALAKVKAAIQKLFDSAREVEGPSLEAYAKVDPVVGPWKRSAPFTNTGLETQNGQYDRLCLAARLGLIAPSPAESPDSVDTILIHHAELSYLPHNLGFLGSMYTEVPFYKSDDEGGAWSASSDAALFKYNIDDVRVTRAAAAIMRDEAKERPATWDIVQHDEWQEYQAQRWRHAGVEVDAEALEYFRWHYGNVRDKALVKMRELVAKRLKEASKGQSSLPLGKTRKVKKTKFAEADEEWDEKEQKYVKVADAQPAHVRSAALDELMARLEALDESDDEELTSTDALGQAKVFNPGSLIQLRLLLAELGIPLSERTATGELSTAKEFLQAAYKSLLEAKVPKGDDRISLLDYLFAWREAAKVHSTYLYPEVVPAAYLVSNGGQSTRSKSQALRIHPCFNVHVVPTGRLSSKGPNFQNQPAEIRGMFRARPGHVLVMGDWDALEMRLGAYQSGDASFIADLVAYDAKTGPKIHIINMCAVFDLKDVDGKPMDPKTKELDKKYPGMYRAAKVFAYAVAYGAGPQTVFEQCRKEMPELDFATFEACYNRYKQFRKGLFAFQSKVVLEATMNGFIDTVLFGRRIYFHERGYGQDSPEASAMQNAPYQGGGADIVSNANKRVWKEVVIPFRRKLRTGEVIEQLAQVHDELVFEVPERLAEKFAAEFKRVAEQLPEGAKFKKWGKLPVDVKVSKRWKPVLARCDAEKRDGKGIHLVITKCKNDVELEVESRLPHATYWGGKCKACGNSKITEVPYAAAA